MKTSSKLSLILLEDDHDLRKSLADYLRLRGFDVVEAASGVDFHKALAQKRCDLAILDVNLPDVSGFDLARIVAARRDMGIIILTARQEREDRLRGYDDGADLFFVKPVDGEELARAARNLIARVRRGNENGKGRENIVSTPVGAGKSWVLNRKSQMLHSPESSAVQLSGRETMLIEFIAHHPSSTIPRMDLLQFYDPVSVDPFSRRFDVAFGRLRAKAKEAGIELPIQVIRGSGVRRVEEIEVV